MNGAHSDLRGNGLPRVETPHPVLQIAPASIVDQRQLALRILGLCPVVSPCRNPIECILDIKSQPFFKPTFVEELRFLEEQSFRLGLSQRAHESTADIRSAQAR